MRILATIIALLGLVILLGYAVTFEYAYLPPQDKVFNTVREPIPAADFWGERITTDAAAVMQQTGDGKQKLSPHEGAVLLDEEFIRLGREAFYRETFGNEAFLSDVLGILDGPLTAWEMAKALIKLGGKGTTNLQVALAETTSIAGKQLTQGTPIDTGLDVAEGAFVPLGVKIILNQGRIKAGITCAACHATVHPDTKTVLEGVTNHDVNAGTLLALGSNSASYFVHTGISLLSHFVHEPSRMVITTTGKPAPLPDPILLEQAVDAALLKWPQGFFDSSNDQKSEPTQIPDSFTLGDHPYGWSGFAAAGPFKGLSVLNNNVHALNSDALTNADGSPALFDLDKEVYLGVLLQNAALPQYRFDPQRGQRPSEFFAAIDPTPGIAGVNHLVTLPTFPKASLVSPDGLWLSRPEYRVWEQVNALSAFQNTLQPPVPPGRVEDAVLTRGRVVFEQAGCQTCHSGPRLTNNRIIPQPQIKTEPMRAQAFKKTATQLVPPLAYSFDTPVPIPADAHVLKVPVDQLDPGQIALAFAKGDSPGGYKVPSLIGLYWSAPYLHDGGVAVGIEPSKTGVAATLLQHRRPDPVNSMRALLDEKVRTRVIEANHATADLQAMNIKGVGHEFWIDSEHGFSTEDQTALIMYLLYYRPPTGG